MKLISSNRMFEGEQRVYEHAADSVSSTMRFGVYLPPKALAGAACPVLYFLSGLTCTEQNVITKGGFQRDASRLDLIVVSPDTSPRGTTPDDTSASDTSASDTSASNTAVPDDEAYDLGQGAGFYLNATAAPWNIHFQMESYVTEELPRLIEQEFSTTDRTGITGHSMGGHGALTLFFRHPDRYASVSAFSPIVAPSQVPWGRKAFSAYLGAENQTAWLKHDASALVGAYTGTRREILIDQGDADAFLEEQLRPEVFRKACEAADQPLTLRMQPGYDHSYYFIATFMPDHIAHHAAALHQTGQD